MKRGFLNLMGVGSYSLKLSLTQYTNNEIFITWAEVGPFVRYCHICLISMLDLVVIIFSQSQTSAKFCQ